MGLWREFRKYAMPSSSSEPKTREGKRVVAYHVFPKRRTCSMAKEHMVYDVGYIFDPLGFSAISSRRRGGLGHEVTDLRIGTYSGAQESVNMVNMVNMGR